MGSSAVESDAVLVSQARKGERAAFGTLVERYQNVVCAIAYSRLGNSENAQDVAQEAFLVSLENLSTLRSGAKFGPWLRKITHRLCNRWQRSETYRRSLNERLRQPGQSARLRAPLDEMDARENGAILRNAVERLPQSLREALVVHYFEGQSHEEAARSLGISCAALKKRLARAKSRIRGHLTSELERKLRDAAPERDFAKRTLAVVPLGSICGQLGLNVARVGVGTGLSELVGAAAQHTSTVLSGGGAVMAKKGMIAAVGLVLLAAGGTGYLLLREMDTPAEGTVAAVSQERPGEAALEPEQEKSSTISTGGQAEAARSEAPEGEAFWEEAGEPPVDPVQVATEAAMDQEMLAHLRKLVGGEVDEELSLEDYSWEALAHALAHKDERILLAKNMLGEGHYDEAIAMLREIIADGPDEDVASLAHLMMGIAMMAKEDRAGALVEFKLIIEDYARSAAVLEAAHMLASCSFRLGSTLEGLEWAMALLEEDPNNMGASLALWRLMSSQEARFVSKEELERRWEICMAAMKVSSIPAKAYDAALALAKSMVMVDRGKMFQMLQEIARNCPDPTIAANAKVELLDRFATWDPVEGIRLGEEVLASEADEAMKKQARRWMFYAYMAQGNVEQAQAMFGQMLSDGWSDEQLGYMLNMGMRGASVGDGEALSSWLVHLSTKEGAAASEALRLLPIVTSPWELDGLFDGDSSTLLSTGGALLASGNYDLAEAVGMRCLEEAQGVDYLRATELIARAKAARGEYQEAAECIRNALAQTPGMTTEAEYAIQVPEYMRLGGYYDEALAAYQQVVEQYPDSVSAPRALYLMAEVHRVDLDQPEVAYELYELVVNEYPDSLYADHARQRLESSGEG